MQILFRMFFVSLHRDVFCLCCRCQMWCYTIRNESTAASRSQISQHFSTFCYHENIWSFQREVRTVTSRRDQDHLHVSLKMFGSVKTYSDDVAKETFKSSQKVKRWIWCVTVSWFERMNSGNRRKQTRRQDGEKSSGVSLDWGVVNDLHASECRPCWM